jgi:formate dehydrogenase accessory protein FdhD
MKIPRVPVIILQKDKALRDTAMVIPETVIEVRLNDKSVTTIVCRPDNPEEPSIGFLLNQGAFPSPEDIKAIRVHPRQKTVSIQAQIDDEALKKLIRSGARSQPYLDRTALSRVRSSASSRKAKASVRGETGLFRSLYALTVRFRETIEVTGIFGAYHVAALANKKNRILCEAGDVGMSVTVDRVFGKAFLAGLDNSNLTLLISGRLRADTVSKAAYRGVSCVVTTSVVTRLALEAGLDCGVDIVGVKEEGALTVYSRHTSRDLGRLGHIVAGRGSIQLKVEKP